MGSKRLKAVVVLERKKGLPMADPEAVRQIMKVSQPRIMGDPDMEDLAVHGTAGIVEYPGCYGWVADVSPAERDDGWRAGGGYLWGDPVPRVSGGGGGGHADEGR